MLVVLLVSPSTVLVAQVNPAITIVPDTAFQNSWKNLRSYAERQDYLNHTT